VSGILTKISGSRTLLNASVIEKFRYQKNVY